MIFEYPLILVAEREFLESFQRGNLYMISCMHYQQMEKEDPQRGDKYDGAVKCTHRRAIAEKYRKSQNIVIINIY